MEIHVVVTMHLTAVGLTVDGRYVARQGCNAQDRLAVVDR